MSVYVYIIYIYVCLCPRVIKDITLISVTEKRKPKE